MSKNVRGRTSSKKISRLVLIGIIVAVFALGATAAVSLRRGETKEPTSQTNSTRAESTRTTANFRASAPIPLNQQTGQVRPLTQEEAQRLAAGIKQLVNQSTDGLQTVVHADGTVSMDLQGRFQSMIVARRNEDGELVQSCIDNREAAAVFFGIDPELVGVKKNSAAPRVTPNANSTAQPKGGVR
jgi:hypothetical protein